MRQPGDLTETQQIASMIRVDQAGEYGAKRIYAGQIAVLKRQNTPEAKAALPIIEHMAEQEEAHLQAFNQLVAARNVRPTLLQPFWHVAGFAMGAATALLGPKAAMACTVAVESVIDEHYAEQLTQLDAKEGDLKEMITRFRAEEIEHHDTGLAEGAQQAPFYPLLSEAVKFATRTAIFLSKKI